MKAFSHLRLAGAGLLVSSLLAACTPTPPPYEPGAEVRFTLPEGAENERLQIAALYTTRDEQGNVVQKALKTTGYVTGRQGNIYLPRGELNEVLGDSNCLPYRADKVARVTEPANVRSCDINFVAYDGSNGAPPSLANLRYLTHDTYSYASEALTYTSTFSGKDGDVTVTSQERGERRAGWSLVPHMVLNPSSNANLYQVIRNSADDAQLGLPRVMHAPSDYFTSMGIRTGGAQ